PAGFRLHAVGQRVALGGEEGVGHLETLGADLAVDDHRLDGVEAADAGDARLADAHRVRPGRPVAAPRRLAAGGEIPALGAVHVDRARGDVARGADAPRALVGDLF